MITSMTGYGKGSLENDKLIVDVDVKSVNNRFLDLSIKLPSFLSGKEYELRELVKNKISRGKVLLNLQVKLKKDDVVLGEVDKDRLKAFLNQVKEIKKTAKITEKIQLEHLLENRQVFIADAGVFGDEEFAFIKAAVNQALDNMIIMKKNEGRELSKDLSARLKLIEEKAGEIVKISKESVIEDFEKLKERVKALVEDQNLNKERLETEIALIADKADITEECVRLKSHLKFFNESMEKESEPGRKLNFLCQELNREANTISSKSIATEIIHSIVIVKEEIEKIREQIQNIE
jgi:uncharacterized protein (TIGR00255 family)